MRNVTALERWRSSMALSEGIENGNASRSGTVSQQISAEIRPPVGSATPPVNSTQLHGLVAARDDRLPIRRRGNLVGTTRGSGGAMGQPTREASSEQSPMPAEPAQERSEEHTSELPSLM